MPEPEAPPTVPRPTDADELSTLGRVASSGVGWVLRGLVATLARVRPADKPIHPRGEVCLGRLERPGAGARPGPTGAAFLDEAGDDAVVARFSRSVGLPEPLPDVDGLALRVPTPGSPDGHADILLATTGRGRATRYLLAPSTRPRSGFYSTLLPYRSPTGPVHLAARASDDVRWELAWARPGDRTWWQFATLTLDRDPGRDLELSFDAVLAAPAGLQQYEWHRRLREPSYAVARRLRHRRHRRSAAVTEPAGDTGH